MDSLSIVIPAYNEESRLPQTLRLVLDWLARGNFSFLEVIVVDDGSRDGTARVVEEFGQDNKCLRLVRNPGNHGKGYAVRHGMLEAEGEWILYTDADLSAPIDELEKLCRAAREQNAGIAIGSRAVDRSLVEVHQPALRELSGRCFQSGDAIGDGTGIPGHAVRVQIVSGERGASNLLAAEAGWFQL